jgi:hypothetical protein
VDLWQTCRGCFYHQCEVSRQVVERYWICSGYIEKGSGQVVDILL